MDRARYGVLGQPLTSHAGCRGARTYFRQFALAVLVIGAITWTACRSDDAVTGTRGGTGATPPRFSVGSGPGGACIVHPPATTSYPWFPFFWTLPVSPSECDRTVTITSPAPEIGAQVVPGMTWYAPGAFSDVPAGMPLMLSNDQCENVGSRALRMHFDRPIKQVTVSIYDSNLPNNSMTAYSATGAVLGRVTFASANPDSVHSVIATMGATDTRAIDALGIAEVLIRPDSSGVNHPEQPTIDPTYYGECVLWTMSFVPDSSCPPTNTLLDDPDVRAGLTAPRDSSQVEGAERAGWIYRNPATGQRRVVFWNDPPRSACLSMTESVRRRIPRPQPTRRGSRRQLGTVTRSRAGPRRRTATCPATAWYPARV